MCKIIEKSFSSLNKLNEFVDENKVTVISIDKQIVKKVMDFPFFDNQLHYYDDTEYVLFYNE